MSKKNNGNKSTTAAKKQPTKVKPVENVKTPNTQTGNDSKEFNTPIDGEGCEAVTVVIISEDEERATVAARSVKKNLKGVDAEILVIGSDDQRNTMPATLLELLPKINTERIVLMTSSMIILNPVTLGDIACVKGPKSGVYEHNLPVIVHKEPLEAVLNHMIEHLPYAHVIDVYYKGVYPDVQPVNIGPWDKNVWMLPVISNNPSPEALRKYGDKKFMYISENSWSQSVKDFLNEKFPE